MTIVTVKPLNFHLSSGLLTVQNPDTLEVVELRIQGDYEKTVVQKAIKTNRREIRLCLAPRPFPGEVAFLPYCTQSLIHAPASSL